MRAALFRGILKRLVHKTPDWVKRIQLQLLLNATAEGFGVKAKSIWKMKAGEALYTYASFTQKCMKKIPDASERLYQVSFSLGEKIREVTGFTQKDDLEMLVFFLYQNIGITMTGQIPGEITVKNCFFSCMYSQAQCQYISAMDRGMIAGIYGGGEFTFAERITEGRDHCIAHFMERMSNE